MVMKKIPNDINKVIEEFVIEINKILGNRARKIILYGSYARGDFNKNSDIDIMVLTDLEDHEISKCREKVSGIAYDVEANNGFIAVLSPIIKNINKFNYWLEALPFYMNVEKEGVILSKC